MHYIITGHTLGAIKRNVLDPMAEMFGVNTRTDNAGTFELWGNRIHCFGSDKADSYKSMTGMTAHGWYGNEVTLSHENTITEAFSRISGEGARVFWDTNPDYPEHPIKLQYIDKSGEKLNSGQIRVLSHHFTIENNPYLPADYIETLKATTPPGMWYDRRIKGLWVAAEGLVYELFDRNTHVYKPFPLPTEWRRYRAIDFGYCVDETTEILTQRGWLNCDQVKLTDRCLTISPQTGKAEWEDIQLISIFPAQIRSMISAEIGHHSSLTTPNHKWLCQKWNRKHPEDLRFKTSEMLSATDQIPMAAEVINLPQEKYFSDDFVELMAWYWTEGSRWKNGNGNTRGELTGGEISQNKGEKAERIQKILRNLYGEPSANMREGKRIIRTPKWKNWIKRSNAKENDARGTFAINGPALQPILKWIIEPQKIVKPEFLLALTQEQLEIFIKTSLLGDGNIANKNGTMTITQANCKRLDSMQMACQLAGYATTLKDRSSKKYKLYRLTIFIKKHRHFMPLRIQKWTTYEGRIWCPTTRNGTWLARRNGTVYFTGNTNPFVCLWGAVDYDGRLYIYDEHYKPNTLIADHAAAIHKRSGEYVATVADHDAQERAELYTNDVQTRAAKKDVAIGIQRVAERLVVQPDKYPRLFISANCINLIRELGKYAWEERKPDKPVKEEPRKVDDHACDALRYMIMELDEGTSGVSEIAASKLGL